MNKGLPSTPVKITLDVLGDRGFPLVQAKIPESFLTDFNELLQFAQERNPQATAEDVVRCIWRYGTRSFWQSLRTNKAAAFKYLPMPEDITRSTKVPK